MLLLLDAFLESVPVTANGYVPFLIGTPLIVPSELLKLSPGGSDPEVSRDRYGGAPPMIFSDAEYTSLSFAVGRELAPIANGLGGGVGVGVPGGVLVGGGRGVGVFVGGRLRGGHVVGCRVGS